MKKLRQAAEKEKGETQQVQKSRAQQTFLESDMRVTFHTRLIMTINTPYSVSLKLANLQSIDQPPRLS